MAGGLPEDRAIIYARQPRSGIERRRWMTGNHISSGSNGSRRRLSLAAERLRILKDELCAEGSRADAATDILELPAKADVVVCAASLPSPSLLLGQLAPGAIVCDAGYPKNLSPLGSRNDSKVFYGGLGQVTSGMTFTPDLGGVLNRHPFPDVVHGCLLEGMTLALERRYEPFSEGRGFITPERVEEMERMAARHGIHLAPLYNSDGPIEHEHDLEPEGIARWA
jgi:fatty aldehyde-generating acyl-ACP reductase